MIALRSLGFNLLAGLWTATLMVACLPLMVSRRATVGCLRLWARGIEALLTWIVGLRWCLRGAANLPAGPAIVAANHQSAWETVMLYRVLDAPAFVLKRELMRAPGGWYAWRAGAIPIDRAGGAATVRAMVAAARRALARGQTVVIFPEGTRTAPGARRPFHPGVAALYRALDVPVVPMAHNAGVYWGRKTFLKRPGTVVLEALPVIPPGLGRAAFMARLVDAIDGAAQRLTAEARQEHNMNNHATDGPRP